MAAEVSRMIRSLILVSTVLLAACGDNVETPAPRTAAPAAEPAAPGAPAATAPPTAAGPAASAAAATVSTIPANFRGEWNATVADCGTARNDSTMRVSADRVVFHEGSGNVRSVQVHADYDISVNMEFVTEGKTTRWERRWKLADDNTILQDVTDGTGLVRHRCKA